jgi:hypothetical protein
MPQPQISWYNIDNTSQVTQWLIGTIDAGTVSPDTTFLIWNNRGGPTAVSDATNCSITTKDIAGGNTGDLVEGKWVEVRVDTMGETEPTPIGGTTVKAVKAGGTAPAGTISGAANDGTKANSPNNFAQVTLHVNVNPLAVAGNIDFLLRLSYQYT